MLLEVNNLGGYSHCMLTKQRVIGGVQRFQMQVRNKPDYEKLRLLLEIELVRRVGIEEATGIGKYLVNVYEILLHNRGDHDTL